MLHTTDDATRQPAGNAIAEEAHQDVSVDHAGAYRAFCAALEQVRHAYSAYFVARDAHQAAHRAYMRDGINVQDEYYAALATRQAAYTTANQAREVALNTYKAACDAIQAAFNMVTTV